MADPVNTVLKNEGGVVDNPADKGGLTVDGISQTNNPGAFVNGPPTDAQARAIYESKYVKAPGFDKIVDKQLQTQLIDFGVNSGPAVAIMKLQGILHVAQDGVLGPATLAALASMHADDVNNLLVAERIRMICRLVQKNPSQLQFLFGWANRALQFLE